MDHQQITQLLDRFHQTHALVLGDLMLDRFVYGVIERISPEAPVPVLCMQRIVDMPGGAANVARNVAALGARVSLIGVAGADETADALRRQLDSVSVISASLITDPSRPTTLKTRYVADRQQVLRSDMESREPLSDEVARAVLDEFRSRLPAADIVILSDYSKGVLTESMTRAAIDAARHANKPVLVDPKSRSFLKYRGATVLTPNRLELQVACGTECSTDEQITAAARGVLENDICGWLVVTRGKDGMSVVRKNEDAIHIGTVAKDVFDVSGAGDTVVSTMGLAMAAGANVVDAAGLANIAAGIVVGKYGTATVTTGEIVATLARTDSGTDRVKNFTLAGARQLVQEWRSRGLRVAFANGCFDLLHPGHLSLLERARSEADKLIVGLNSDLSVTQLKGPGRPIQSEVARATVLASLKCVDAVVIFGEPTPLELIKALVPDVLVKGADYTLDKVVGADFVMERGGKVVLADLVPAQSTTNTLKRVASTSKS